MRRFETAELKEQRWRKKDARLQDTGVTPPPRTCAQCGMPFMMRFGRRHPMKRFCSVACRLNFHNDATTRKRREQTCWADWAGRERQCNHCGAPFRPVRRRQRYCCFDCSQRQHVLELQEQRAAKKRQSTTT
jgi:hypothetical protein